MESYPLIKRNVIACADFCRHREIFKVDKVAVTLCTKSAQTTIIYSVNQYRRNIRLNFAQLYIDFAELRNSAGIQFRFHTVACNFPLQQIVDFFFALVRFARTFQVDIFTLNI